MTVASSKSRERVARNFVKTYGRTKFRRLLEADPRRPVADVATAVGVSHQHLVREFTRWVGLTPRVLARLLRMRGLLDALDVHAPVPWSELAHAWGWFDQAHLIRDFKRHTGVTPTQYLDAQRATPATPGFVPEGERAKSVQDGDAVPG